MKDPLHRAVVRQHLGWVLDKIPLQGSQTQTPVGAMLSESRTKTIGTKGNLEFESACPV